MKKVILISLLISTGIYAQSTWIPMNVTGTGVFEEMYFLNNNTGWVVGQSGLIYKTTDGGLNWNNQISGTNYELISVYFINENTGWTAGLAGLTRKTSDGGQNWENSLIGGPANCWKIYFLNEITGFNLRSGYNSVLYKTTNSGNNWFYFSNITGYKLRTFQFLDSNIGFAAGYNGVVMKTNNGGINWFYVKSPNWLSEVITDLFFVNPNTGWIVGDRGYIAKSTDGGYTWISQNTENNYSLYGCYFTGIKNGWAVGSEGTIKRTTDGGNNWFSENSGTTTTLFDIKFNGNDTGFISGGELSSSLVILRTTDGGYTSPSEPDQPLNLMAVADSNIRINLSWTDNSDNEDGFTIERSIDGGSNWSVLNTTSQNIISYPDTGLTPYSIYYYRVYAFNSTGNSPYSNIAWDTAKSYLSCDNILVLITKINDLKNENVINQGQANSLIVKLNSACEFRNRGQLNAAINQMGAFINQVIAFINANIFTQEQGQSLITIANDIISSLENGNFPLYHGNNSENMPKVNALFNNYPNPFNPISKIKYQNAIYGNVTLKVFDITGKEVAVLVNEEKNPGEYEVTFDGTNLPSGVYFYQLKAGSYSQTKKMLLIK